MAVWLANQGHSVHVVTAPPYYPEWKIWQGYSGWQYQKESIEGVMVYRCPIWVPKQPTGLKRLIHLATFALSSAPVILSHIFWRADVVWVVTPAFFTVPTALLTAKLSGAKSWVHIQDFEIDAAFDLGIIKGKYLKSVVSGMESWILKQFDIVSTISNRMMERLISKGISSEKSVLFPNWANITTKVQEIIPTGIRDELKIPHNAIIALYSGNMGAKQGLEILASVAEALANHNNLYFVFCGNGVGRTQLDELCAGLGNVRLMDLQPLDKYADLMSTADVHLLPQRADAADLVLPSKLTAMLASGKPVIATALSGTEIAHVIKECGVIVPPENPMLFADALISLVDNTELRATMGKAARIYAETYLDKEGVLAAFESSLKK